MNTSCQNSLAHEDCGYNPKIVEREGHQADRDSWQRSKKLTYRRKIAAQRKLK